MIEQIVIGIVGGVIGGLTMVAGNIGLYLYQDHKKAKLLKEFQKNINGLVNAVNAKPAGPLAKVMQFKAPTPPTKIN